MTKKLLLAIFALMLMSMPVLAADAGKAPTAEEVQKENTGEPAQQESKAMELDLTLGDPEDSEMGTLGIAFKNYVLMASKGKINVHLDYSGGLDADESFQFHRVQTGKLPMALGGIGNLAPMVKPLGIVTLPYLFPDAQAVIAGTTGKAAELLNSYAEKAGVRILAWTYYGYRFISNSKHPIVKLADMKGMRIRVPQSLAMIKTYRAFGAIPMPLAWPMTKNALKNDLVDGQCYDLSGFRAMRFQEAGQKYITEIHYLYNLQPLVMNLKLFRKLSPEDQKIMVDAGKYIQDLSQQYQKEMNNMARRMLISEGVHISKLEDESEWRNLAISKVWPQVADSIGGKAAVNDYLQACGLPLWEPAEAQKADKK